MDNTLIGAIEAGGTKTVCGLGSSVDEIRNSEKLVVPTTSPVETIQRISEWFEQRSHGKAIQSFGVASFGPLDFSSHTVSLTSPKKVWRDFSWPENLTRRFENVIVALDTDTNGAGIAESRWGASRECTVSVYLTVGTGIGGSLIVDGAPVHGIQHPEFGHMFVPRVPGDDFEGTCPSHGACLEGLTCGPAIEQRWRTNGTALPADHPAWELESQYLSYAIANIVAVSSPEIIVMGGGIMSVDGLIEKIRRKSRKQLGGYYSPVQLNDSLPDYVVTPGLGSDSGIVGAFALGLDALTH